LKIHKLLMINISNYRQEIQESLRDILHFWQEKSLDLTHGGFIGKMDYEGIVHPKAEKGGVLNARILWTFSAAYNFTKNVEYLQIAERAYNYIQKKFRDEENGGVYWSVDFEGNPLNTRKQIYSQAFTIYGLAEFYKATQNVEALNFAKGLFYLIEKYSFDVKKGGYFEAFSNNWEHLDDLRLSEKDRNDPKTMNTHLHILEAYTSLFEVWKDSELEKKIRDLLNVFEEKIIDSKNNHMRLFFDVNWLPTSQSISFGHDIEAAWLLQEASEVLKDECLITKFKIIAVKMADAAAEGLQKDGSIIHEFDPITNHQDTHREWWVEAEGMVGFLNAYQITKSEKYLSIVQGVWNFTKRYLKDFENGEWIWGVYEDYSPMKNEDKIGFWKCPYHNSRACIEVLKRINNITST
jgi:cellobiose epimerase